MLGAHCLPCRVLESIPLRGGFSLHSLFASDLILLQFNVRPLGWKTMGFVVRGWWGEQACLWEGGFWDMLWWSKDVQLCVYSHSCCWLAPTCKQSRNSPLLIGFLYLLALGLLVYTVIMRSLWVFGSVNLCGIMSQCLSRNCGMAVSNVASALPGLRITAHHL